MVRSAFTTDEIFPINADLQVVYSLWNDGTVFRRRGADSWQGVKVRGWQEPWENVKIKALSDQGVEWLLVEHVSVTVAGNPEYTYDLGGGGTVTDIGAPGEHNVENGGGYIPLYGFSRDTKIGHISCCLINTAEANEQNDYWLDVVTDKVLDAGADFAHYCLGPKAKTTEYNVLSGLMITGTAIIGRLL